MSPPDLAIQFSAPGFSLFRKMPQLADLLRDIGTDLPDISLHIDLFDDILQLHKSYRDRDARAGNLYSFIAADDTGNKSRLAAFTCIRKQKRFIHAEFDRSDNMRHTVYSIVVEYDVARGNSTGSKEIGNG